MDISAENEIVFNQRDQEISRDEQMGGGDTLLGEAHLQRTNTTPETSEDMPIHLTSSPLTENVVNPRTLRHTIVPPKMIVKPDLYDGKGDWSEYISQFSDCAELGRWDDRAKCLVLAANLRGAARKYYTGLSADEKQDYLSLTGALRRRFGGEHRQESWLSKLEMRKRKTGESVSDLGDDIWQMAQKAYYDFDHKSQEMLALKHFHRMIEPDMKVKCVENKCTNLADAVTVVERYEALYEDRRAENKKVALRAMEVQPDATTLTLERILSQLDKIETRQNQLEQKVQHKSNNNRYQRRSEKTCYGCGEAGHYIASCPYESGNRREPQSEFRSNTGASQRMHQGNFNPSN